MSNYNVPNLFSPFSPADATQLNTNFTELETLLNSTGIDSTGLATNSVTTAKIINDAVTTPKIADGAITTAKFASGAITAIKNASTPVESTPTNIMDFASNGASYTQVTTNGSTPMTCSIVTNGRPVLLQVQPASTTTPGATTTGAIGHNNVITTSLTSNYALYRNSTPIAYWKATCGSNSGTQILHMLEGFKFLDVDATATTNVYSIYYNAPTTNEFVQVYHLELVAIEL